MKVSLEDFEKGFIAREMMGEFCLWFFNHKQMSKDDFFNIQKIKIKEMRKNCKFCETKQEDSKRKD